MHTRWKKNPAGMLAAGPPECRYVATVDASYAVDMMNKVRKALSIGGPTFIHSFDPCPKGGGFDPMLSPQLREPSVGTGPFPPSKLQGGGLRRGPCGPSRGGGPPGPGPPPLPPCAARAPQSPHRPAEPDRDRGSGLQ